ncbi:MAG TPA: CheR family methyltransferase [Gallionella sp.]|nr:CheR family methyltransferase [Gallionella sp.]
MIHLTTGETYFFRDSGQFELLRKTILPELIERRQSVRTLRIWSAACSSGEEAYSLAMLLDEVLSDQSGWNILLLGSDVNECALEKARHAVYTEWSFRSMDDSHRRRYFRRHGGGWALDHRIRERVTFRMVNMLADPFPDAGSGLIEMDLILCRNLFIYLQPAMVSKVVDKLTETLAEQGYLLTGHGELYAHHPGKLQSRIFPESIIYQKVSEPVLAPFVPAGPTRLPQWQQDRTETETRAKPAAVSRHVHRGPVIAKEAAKKGKPASDKTVSDEMQQAWEFANQGQWEKAAASCTAMINAYPLDAEPYYLSALLAQERGDVGEAITLLKKSIYLAPEFVAAYLELGDIYERERNIPQATKMRSTALELLKKLPPDELIKPYGAFTVKEILEYLEQLINSPSPAS